MSSSSTPIELGRQELHKLVWERPVRTIATELGVSDVAIHKACRRHRVPTPPPGYWAKLQFGKRVTQTPLPRLEKGEEHLERITIHRQWQPNLASDETVELESPAEPAAFLTGSPEARLINATVAKLEKVRPNRDGLLACEGSRLVNVSVRPETLPRVRPTLEALFATAKANSIDVLAQVTSAKFQVGDETVSFSIEEVADKVPHEPTEKELRAVVKWEADRDATLKRGGYWWERNPPPIPKWEQRYQGRLAVRLEEVRARSDNNYWGTTLRGTYSDAGKQRVEDRSVVIIRAVIRSAEAKRNNKTIEARRRAAEEEAARRRAEEARRAAIKVQREQALKAIEKEQNEINRLESLLVDLEAHAGDTPPARYKRLLSWIRHERDEKRSLLSPANIEPWLQRQGCFESDDPAS